MINILSSFPIGLITAVGVFIILTVVVFSVGKIIKAYRWSLFRIDRMKGDDFEDFIKEIYIILGYTVEKTKKSGDQGIDLIIKKHFRRIGIQLKRYSHTVGNSAVQEAVAGRRYYRLDKVCVLTNSTYTKSAKELAKVNKVELIDRKDLKELIEKAKNKVK